MIHWSVGVVAGLVVGGEVGSTVPAMDGSGWEDGPVVISSRVLHACTSHRRSFGTLECRSACTAYSFGPHAHV